MRISFILLGFLLTSSGFSQKTDPLRKYFLEYSLILPAQLAHFDTSMSEAKKSYIESYQQLLKEAKTDDERKMYRQQIKKIQDLDFSHGMISAEPGDTLTRLMSYLTVTSLGSLTFYALGFSANYSDSSLQDYKVPVDSLINFLNNMEKAGLITNLTEQRVLAKISAGKIIDSFSVVKSAIEMKELEDYFSPHKTKKFLDRLVDLKIMKQEAAARVQALSLSFKLTDPMQILTECERAVVIDLNKFGDYPQDYMLPLYQSISSILPELSFTDFDVKVERYKESYDTSWHYRTIVSLINSGQKYSHSDFYSPSDFNEDGRPDHAWKTGDDIVSIFNKILRDKQSSYRIHVIEAPRNNREDSSYQIGFLALTKAQQDSLHRGGTYLNIQYQKYRNAITSNSINNAIRIYKELGLFSHLTQDEIDSSISSIQQKQINYYSDILSCFRDLVFEIDPEFGVEEGMYKQLTKELIAVSKNQFQPIDIVDTYHWKDRKSFDYGFTLNGKKYKAKLKQEDDWLDPGFFELIEKAVAEQDKKGKFYPIYPNDGMRYIYLTKEQYQILKEKNLLEFEDVEE